MNASLPADRLQQLWPGIVKQMGEFKRFGDARVEPFDAAYVVFVTCEFEKFTLDARVPINKEGLVSGFNFGAHSDYTPPDYVKTASFHEKDVMVGSGAWALHGTLTVPNGTGPFPALILVHGSGPYDRDYTLGPNKIFRDIAWGVASRGVAVLHYNKRTFEHPIPFSKLESATVKEESVDDALLAAALLRGMPEINPKKILVLGHSLGGTVAPRIGKADPSISGLIIAGGAALPILDHFVPQAMVELAAKGPMTRADERQLERLKAQVERAQDPDLKPDMPALDLPLGASASYWLDLRSYHPDQVALGLKQPMLILQGGGDYRVTRDDLAVWQKTLNSRKDVSFKVYPKLNHNLIEGEGPSSNVEYRKPGHASVAVIEDIAAWINR